MRAGQRLGELVTIRRLEPQALPEPSGTATEQPSSRRAFGGRAIQSEAGQLPTSPTRPLRRVHRHAPDQRVLPIRADLIPGTADDLAALVALEPQTNAGRLHPTQSQIDRTQEGGQRLDIRRPTPLEIHAPQ
jgi:hypothetical protein